MSILSSLGGYLTKLGIRLASLRNAKARLIVEGRKQTLVRLREKLVQSRPTVWFHVASLGEFEQGRPLMEAVRKACPEWQILLTFFSPSGYEVRHSYEGADCVVYLPSDTPRDVETFLDLSRPRMAIFVKYDFWPTMLEELRRRGIPTYLVSAIFQERQLFFKPWGGWYKKLLRYFDYLWVQDEASRQLLARHGIHHSGVAGDTRFDRAKAIADEACDILEIAYLRARKGRIVVAGSTWREDEMALASFAQGRSDVGLVIAPHEIDEAHLKDIEERLPLRSVRLSTLRRGNGTNDYDAIIIDCFGLLAALYRYADVAYIGGGFGKSIHNSVEAAVYGLPLVFGPRMEKFREAWLFLEAGAARVAERRDDVERILSEWLSDESLRLEAADAARSVVESQLGATDILLRALGFAPKTETDHSKEKDNEDQ